ncbi:uncharacterized protein K460DRAFT_67051 [Cucurbitaria berberidis CBS 394.84]|uniref:Uncharacterized protein n=1 Tax=Cucurbitaria berberidis CBS 394.84 TaxID=1168544 RepID=A0A9P4LA52_9PLEO|nr:uncharacterized protein K460DRAFT_67051 [Cucurbitaria berberidis CBS 394.84]KAF1848016.1 hypothetical protein K460DRAFT_67051 [Cucurbitaria berberidis CBS 394.84]
MPATRPRPSDQPQPKMTKENVRTAIIVSVIIGTLAVIVLTLFIWSRRIRRSAKAGTSTSSHIEGQDVTYRPLQRHDKELEVGVIQEPLPVYHREPMEDERRLAIAARSSGERGNDRESPRSVEPPLASCNPG